ncbi:hypothetical protein HGM15179_004518 [Zosterops borbonicus]|uniref:RNA-directed DNA polymerase n=1 Tax=Zosterops borbonicus TaxID=364589 RepID=A0A8K1GR87_9PASS|nr:hypothetical protein HGM15179_004518 [Zosterops borbonicus]
MDPPRDPNFDITKRWKGVVTNAEITRDFSFTLLLAALVFALATAGIQLSVHYPSHPLFKTSLTVVERPKVVDHPLVKGLTIFTDASGRTGKYGCAWLQDGHWETIILQQNNTSVQVLELQAVALAMTTFDSAPVNLITDSNYAAGLVNRLDQAIIGHVGNMAIKSLLIKILALLEHRQHPLWCTHIKSHTTLPGILTKGNAVIDQAVSAFSHTADAETPTDTAVSSHKFFHQSARALQKEFGLSRAEARAVVAACPDCARISPIQASGTNPRGLQPRGIWQCDTTELPSFGRLRHLHVSVDTCSRAVWATPATSTAFVAVKQHWLAAFAALGVPAVIKTDNGPAYTSQACKRFMDAWGIQHKTGIPYNSTGQAIIERRHQDIKRLAAVLKKEGELSPYNAVMKACYVLNWKNPVGEENDTPIQNHFKVNPNDLTQWEVLVDTWDPHQGAWVGQGSKLLTWGRGYACVITGESRLRWLPAKWVRPWLPATKPSGHTDSDSEHVKD